MTRGAAIGGITGRGGSGAAGGRERAPGIGGVSIVDDARAGGAIVGRGGVTDGEAIGVSADGGAGGVAGTGVGAEVGGTTGAATGVGARGGTTGAEMRGVGAKGVAGRAGVNAGAHVTAGVGGGVGVVVGAA